MKGRALLFAATLLVAGRMGSQEGPPKEVPQYSLRTLQTVPVSIHDYGFWGGAQCDQDGYIYWRAATTGDFESDPVWKISPKWDRYTEFSVPKELAEEEFKLGAFTVAPDGTLFQVAYSSLNGQVLLLRFDSNGQVSSKTTLAVPERLAPQVVAVFPNGEILLSGRLDQETPAGGEVQRRVAIYAEDGRLQAPVKLPNRKTAANATEKDETEASAPGGEETTQSDVSQLPRWAVAMSEDGNAYLLLGMQIFAVNARGEVSRTVALSDVPSGFEPTNIQVSHGILSVKFMKGRVGELIEQVRFRTIEAVTGIVQADYLPESELGTTQVCFTANEGYKFVVVKEKKGYIARGWIK